MKIINNRDTTRKLVFINKFLQLYKYKTIPIPSRFDVKIINQVDKVIGSSTIGQFILQAAESTQSSYGHFLPQETQIRAAVKYMIQSIIQIVIFMATSFKI